MKCCVEQKLLLPTTWAQIKRSVVFQVCWPKPSRINLFQVFCFLFAAYYKKKRIKKMNNRIGILKARCRCCFFLWRTTNNAMTLLSGFFTQCPHPFESRFDRVMKERFFWIIAGKLSRPLGPCKSQTRFLGRSTLTLGGKILGMAWLWISVWQLIWCQ